MSDMARVILEKYQIRKNKKQKRAFIAYADRKAQEMGYVGRIEKGSFHAENLVYGDVDNAKVIFTAHYDTAPQLPFPNFITPKNIGIYLLYQAVLTIVLCGLIWGIDYLIGFSIGYFGSYFVQDEGMLLSTAALVSSVVAVLLIALLLCGPANKHTANDNTSGVITLLEAMAAMPEELRSRVAFVFFDLEEMGMIGSAAFASRHKAALKNTLVVNFDCVSDGETVLLCVKKKARAFLPYLERAFTSNALVTVDIATKGYIYPSDQMQMPCGVGVAALKKTKSGLLYMDRIHTSRDVIFREVNIDYLVKASVALAEQAANRNLTT